MTRMMAFIAALLMTAVAVSSACVASSVSPLRFTMEPAGNGQDVQVRFRRADSRGTDSWSSSFATSELAGLEVPSLTAAGSRPVRFAIARQAGRLDCQGKGGNSMATGSCALTPDRGFNDFLAATGSPVRPRSKPMR